MVTVTVNANCKQFRQFEMWIPVDCPLYRTPLLTLNFSIETALPFLFPMALC